MKPILVGAVCLLLGVCAVRAEDAKRESPDQTRARYAKQSAEILTIAEPIKVSKILYYKDGGTIGIVLTDAKGKEHSFCQDGRELPSKDPNGGGLGTRGLFKGVTHPTQPGAKLAGDNEVAALYGVMLRWANNHPRKADLFNEKADLNRSGDGNLWESRAFFLRLDGRFVSQ